MRWEQRALDGDVRVQRGLGDIMFTEQVLRRVFYECCALAGKPERYSVYALYISASMSGGFHDEKEPEDLHNHRRDLGRLG